MDSNKLVETKDDKPIKTNITNIQNCNDTESIGTIISKLNAILSNQEILESNHETITSNQQIILDKLNHVSEQINKAYDR